MFKAFNELDQMYFFFLQCVHLLSKCHRTIIFIEVNVSTFIPPSPLYPSNLPLSGSVPATWAQRPQQHLHQG